MSLAQWARRNFMFFILALGIGVFLWGTAYKMSLYKASPIHNKVAVAKLHTDFDKVQREQAKSTTAPRPVTALPLLLDLALFFFTLSVWGSEFSFACANRPPRLVSLHFPPAQFLRPPPFPLHG